MVLVGASSMSSGGEPQFAILAVAAVAVSFGVVAVDCIGGLLMDGSISSSRSLRKVLNRSTIAIPVGT